MMYVIGVSKKVNNVIEKYKIIDGLSIIYQVSILNKNDFKNIFKENEFFTAIKINNIFYEKKSQIFIVNGKNEKYFRSDKNNIEEDNLENLPIF